MQARRPPATSATSRHSRNSASRAASYEALTIAGASFGAAHDSVAKEWVRDGDYSALTRGLLLFAALQPASRAMMTPTMTLLQSRARVP